MFISKSFYLLQRKINITKIMIIKAISQSQIIVLKYQMRSEWNQLKGSVYQINKISKNNFQYDVVFLSESEDKGNINFTEI